MQRPGVFGWILATLSVWLLALSTTVAHVGSPGVLVQRTAGKYRVMISVNPPDVVPGTAQITVWVEQGRVRTVQARPVYFKSGDEGSPLYDDLTAVSGQVDQFSGLVWLMDIGASSVNVRLNGADGQADIVVPLMALATARPTMPLSTILLLSGLAIVLVVLMVTIIRVCSGESLVPPGRPAPSALQRSQRIATGVAIVGLSVILMGGRAWWNSRARDYYQNTFYQPLVGETSVRQSGSGHQLTIAFDNAPNRRHAISLSYLIPDHGKLMHLFLAKMTNADAFAHLHPQRVDTLHYQTILPPLPPGRYRLFADVVYRNGFTETMTDTVTIPNPVVVPTDRYNPDDSWLIGGVTKSLSLAKPVRLDASMAPCGIPAERTLLADGSTMLWTDRPTATLATDQVYRLRFAVADTKGRPAPLEPYLGMGGHAVIMQQDGSVYTHLHPVGTYSMAAETSLVQRLADTARTFQYPDARQFRDSIDQYVRKLDALPATERNQQLAVNMPGMVHRPGDSLHANMVEFPYQFPKPGTYRIWVQVKRNGQVLTGVFDTVVEAE